MLVKTDPWSGTGLKALMFIFYLSINVFYEVLRLEPQIIGVWVVYR
jgi:hypothetical protein